jgi:WD40 repeat protein
VERIVFSPDSRTLATAGQDRLVRLWDVNTGQGRALAGHEGAVEAVAFSPDGRLVVSSSQDRTIRLWEDGLPEDLTELRAWLDRSVNAIIGPNNRVEFGEWSVDPNEMD